MSQSQFQSDIRKSQGQCQFQTDFRDFGRNFDSKSIEVPVVWYNDHYRGYSKAFRIIFIFLEILP